MEVWCRNLSEVGSNKAMEGAWYGLPHRKVARIHRKPSRDLSSLGMNITAPSTAQTALKAHVRQKWISYHVPTLGLVTNNLGWSGSGMVWMRRSRRTLKPLHIYGFPDASVVVRSSLQFIHVALMPGYLHSHGPWKPWPICRWFPSSKPLFMRDLLWLYYITRGYNM